MRRKAEEGWLKIVLQDSLRSRVCNLAHLEKLAEHPGQMRILETMHRK